MSKYYIDDTSAHFSSSWCSLPNINWMLRISVFKGEAFEHFDLNINMDADKLLRYVGIMDLGEGDALIRHPIQL